MIKWFEDYGFLYSEDRNYCIMLTYKNKYRLLVWNDFDKCYDSPYNDFDKLEAAKYQAWVDYTYPAN